MAKLPRPSGKAMVQFLNRRRFIVARIRGSHHFMESATHRTCVPVHANRVLKIGDAFEHSSGHRTESSGLRTGLDKLIATVFIALRVMSTQINLKAADPPESAIAIRA